jgi:hypothetical protein
MFLIDKIDGVLSYNYGINKNAIAPIDREQEALHQRYRCRRALLEIQKQEGLCRLHGSAVSTYLLTLGVYLQFYGG